MLVGGEVFGYIDGVGIGVWLDMLVLLILDG